MSGRSATAIPTVDSARLRTFIAELRELEVRFNYVMNFTTLSNSELLKSTRVEFLEHVERLVDMGVGKFTVTMFTLLPLVNAVEGDFEIAVSTIADVRNPSGLEFITALDKVRHVCVPESLNRDLPRLRRMTEACPGVSFSAIVNTNCVLECMTRWQHYGYLSSKHVGGCDPFMAACALPRLRNPDEILRSPWIRPEDLGKYVERGISLFKVAGRGLVERGADFPRMLAHYADGCFEGDLMALFRAFTPSDFWSLFRIDSEKAREVIPRMLAKKSGCRREECASCTICSEAPNGTVTMTDTKQASIISDGFRSFLGLSEDRE